VRVVVDGFDLRRLVLLDHGLFPVVVLQVFTRARS
jgi:hypothetical protein